MAQIREIGETHPDQRVEVWFQDEARFGQQGTLTRKWARTGSRPPAVKQTQYDWLYVIGAACPETGQSVGLLSPHINTEIMNIFLDQFAREVDPDVHVVMIWDQAGFHCAKNLRVPPNMTILPLPPYSPELNPIENLWHYLRAHYWANREYADWEALRQAACEAWQKACLDVEIVKTVCNAPYITALT
jgi:transposase